MSDVTVLNSVRPPDPANGAGNARAVVHDIQDAFRKNDYARIAARFHDDIDWLFHAPVSIFPFAGARRGKAEVFKGFALLYETYRVTGYSEK